MATMTKYAAIDTVPEPDAGFAPASEEDEVARRLLRPCFPSDRELLLLAGFDAFERLVAFESVDEGTAARCTVAPRRWRSLLGGGVRFVLMAHNHPSAVARPSRADIACTRDAAAFLAVLGGDLIDHLIFVEAGHFSFRRAGLL